MQCERFRGSVMVLTLVILLLLELIAMATVASVNIGHHIIRNHESALAVDRDANNLINYLMTNRHYFLNYKAYLDHNGKFDIAIPDYIVGPPRTGRVVQFECTDCVFANANTATKLTALDQTHWVLGVEVSDRQTGAGTKLMQGLELTTISIEKSAEKPRAGAKAENVSGYRLKGIWWYSQPLVVNRK